MTASSASPILEVEDLSIHIRHAYGNTPVVSGVSFSVIEGENLGIVGESGCGKTLTGLAVIGLLPRLVEASGSIRWKGQDVLRLSPDRAPCPDGSRDRHGVSGSPDEP